MNILNNGRFGIGAASGANIRKAAGMVVAHAKEREQFGAKISSFGLIQARVALARSAAPGARFLQENRKGGQRMSPRARKGAVWRQDFKARDSLPVRLSQLGQFAVAPEWRVEY